MKTKTAKIINLIVIALIMAFIWSRSLKDMAASAQESGEFMETVVIPVEKAILGREVVSEDFVRKCAHVFEFAMLGIALAIYTKKLWPALGIGMAAAVIDETIQYFTGRGSMVTDIWIDTAGCLLGAAAVLLIIAARKRKTVKS